MHTYNINSDSLVPNLSSGIYSVNCSWLGGIVNNYFINIPLKLYTSLEILFSYMTWKLLHYLNRINRNRSSNGKYFRIHIKWKSAVLWEWISQVKEFLIKTLFKAQHLYLLYCWIIQLIPYLKYIKYMILESKINMCRA